MKATVLSIKQANKTSRLIATAGKKMDERIHLVGVSGIYHFYECGDLDILSNLFDAMPKSSRGNAMHFWMTRFAPIKWDKKARKGKGGFVVNKAATSDYPDYATGTLNEAATKLVEEAHSEPFWTKKDTEERTFNPDKYAASIASKLVKENVNFDEFMDKLKAKMESKAAA